MENATAIIKRPILTEKSSNLVDTLNRYVFEVDKDASKYAVKTAVERLFDVKVLDVNTVNYRNQPRRFGRFVSKKVTYYKKAYVQIAEGQKIELFKSL
jgi:large subunit ribosomal protein L23